MKVASLNIRTLYSSSSPRVGSPSRRSGISIVSLRKPVAYSRASGTSLVEVSNVTSRGAHRRLSPVKRPRPKGSALNSAGRMAPKTSNVATTSAPPVIASILTAESGLAICPSIVMSNFPSAEKSRELIFHEHEAGGQNERIGRHREALEAHGPPPRQQDCENDRQCDDLPDFDPDVEAD